MNAYDQCDPYSVSKSLIEKKLKTSDIGPFTCGICQKKYKYRRDIVRHMKSECINCPKNFACSTCGKAFHRFGHLKDHMRKRHNIEQR